MDSLITDIKNTLDDWRSMFFNRLHLLLIGTFYFYVALFALNKNQFYSKVILNNNNIIDYIFGIMVERRFKTYVRILSTMFRGGVLLGRAKK